MALTLADAQSNVHYQSWFAYQIRSTILFDMIDLLLLPVHVFLAVSIIPRVISVWCENIHNVTPFHARPDPLRFTH
jgi:hypothetical protein